MKITICPPLAKWPAQGMADVSRDYSRITSKQEVMFLNGLAQRLCRSERAGHPIRSEVWRQRGLHSEWHVLRQCGFVPVRFMRLVIPIAVISRIEELDPVHVNKIPVILPARFLVFPGFGALAAFQVNTTAFV